METGLIAGMTADGAMTGTTGVMTVAGTMRRGPPTNRAELAAQFRVVMIGPVILKVVATLTPETRIIPDGRMATAMVR